MPFRHQHNKKHSLYNLFFSRPRHETTRLVSQYDSSDDFWGISQKAGLVVSDFSDLDMPDLSCRSLGHPSVCLLRGVDLGDARSMARPSEVTDGDR